MIVAERKNKTVLDNFDRFGGMVTEIGLTVPFNGNGKIYRLKEDILVSQKFGRPLSEEELK
jgi:hypothetical protein